MDATVDSDAIAGSDAAVDLGTDAAADLGMTGGSKATVGSDATGNSDTVMCVGARSGSNPTHVMCVGARSGSNPGPWVASQRVDQLRQLPANFFSRPLCMGQEPGFCDSRQGVKGNRI